MNTRHASIRAQQRGIPPMIDQLLDLYGEEEYDGHGGMILFLSKDSRRRMQKDLGSRPVARMSEWLNAYKVRAADGRTITIGHRTGKIRRK